MSHPDPTVLDAVARILQRDGLRGLTLSSIADQAGISRVTLHRRGISVDDCIVAVLARASDDLRSSLWPAVTGSGNAVDRLEVGLRILCDVAERHAGVLIAFFGETARPIPGSAGRTTSFEFVELFERLLRDGVADGSMHIDDPTRQAVLVANTTCWLYLHMTRAHGWPADEAAERVIRTATASLRAVDQSGSTGRERSAVTGVP